MDREILLDRIKGLVFGMAMGDAVGLSTEFMSKAYVEEQYGTLFADGKYTFRDIRWNNHNRRWACGDWTDDTDQAILLMQSFAQHWGPREASSHAHEPPIHDFAKRLRYWAMCGFPELGDEGGMGLGLTVSRSVFSPEFFDNPIKCAEAVWEASGQFLAANGAVMRTAPIAIATLDDRAASSRVAAQLARVTHADPRAVGSAVAVTIACREVLLRGLAGVGMPASDSKARAETGAIAASESSSDTPAASEESRRAAVPGPVELDELVQLALEVAKPYCNQVGYMDMGTGEEDEEKEEGKEGSTKAEAEESPVVGGDAASSGAGAGAGAGAGSGAGAGAGAGTSTPARKSKRKGGYDPSTAFEELRTHLLAPTLSDLSLDDSKTMGYTLKTAAAGFAAIRQHGPDFRRCICAITGEAGDADTNCAVAGALLGAATGYKGLPADWLEAMPHREWLEYQVECFLAAVRPELGVRPSDEKVASMTEASRMAQEAVARNKTEGEDAEDRSTGGCRPA